MFSRGVSAVVHTRVANHAFLLSELDVTSKTSAGDKQSLAGNVGTLAGKQTR